MVIRRSFSPIVQMRWSNSSQVRFCRVFSAEHRQYHVAKVAVFASALNCNITATLTAGGTPRS